MKLNSMLHLRIFVVAAAVAITLQVPARSALIAEWNFDTGTSADLTSSVGGYTLGRVPGGVGSPGYGNDPVHNPGTLSLDEFTELLATGINSTALPGLQSNATIFTRMKFDSALTLTGFFLGLVNDAKAADFAEMTMTAFEFDTPSRSLAGFGRTNAANDIFAGTLTIPPTGEYFNLAIVVSAGLNAVGEASPGDTQLRLNLNGVEVGVASAGTALQAFQALALGQLKASGGVAPMTFDTVKLYDTSLTALEIAGIPEPASAVLAGAGCIMLGLARRRRV
jgi:hypothetical protein